MKVMEGQPTARKNPQMLFCEGLIWQAWGVETLHIS